MSKEQKPLSFGVDFGCASIGDETARLGVKCSRQKMPIPVATQNLCGKRITAVIVIGGSEADDSQGKLDGMDDFEHKLEASFDVKGFKVKPKHIGFGLTMAIESIDVEELSHFAKQKGRLFITGAEALPEKVKRSHEGDDDTHDDHPDTGPIPNEKPVKPAKGQKALPGVDEGAAMPLTVLNKFGLPVSRCEAISEVYGDNVGKLELAMRKDPQWITKIKGNQKFAEQFATAYGKFREAYQMMGQTAGSWTE